MRTMQPTSPGPERSPTEISLAQLAHVPSHEDVGEGSSRSAHYHPEDIQSSSTTSTFPQNDFSAPPPDYTSPEGSMLERSRRGSNSSGGNSQDDDEGHEERRLLAGRQRELGRDATPIPSYDAAVGERRYELR